MPAMPPKLRRSRRRTVSSSQQKPEAPKGLAALPQSAGIAALVVMVALALPIGNFRALQNATPQAFIRQGDVKSIVEDRISAAQNAVTVAQRSSVSQTTLEDVNNAIKAMQSAKTARDISRADQQLTVAVSQLVDDANLANAEDEKMLTRAADTFAEQGSFSVRRRAYNQKAEKAEKLYENCRPDSAVSAGHVRNLSEHFSGLSENLKIAVEAAKHSPKALAALAIIAVVRPRPSVLPGMIAHHGGFTRIEEEDERAREKKKNRRCTRRPEEENETKKGRTQ
ncbi:MAG: hypothetical protein ACLTBF_10890 [Christensenellales bacterium]